MKITGREVLAYVAKFYDLPVTVLTGPNRRRAIVRPRQMAMYVMRQVCPHLSYPAIGGIIGGRDHTTVIHGVAKIQSLIETGSSVLDDVDAILGHFTRLLDPEAEREALIARIEATERQLQTLKSHILAHDMAQRAAA